ncbi:hypothetical protein KM043_001928 [Ampulex compressa]|nr:hypothetical protein KM043_001928 [Ampulex compressa]
MAAYVGTMSCRRALSLLSQKCGCVTRGSTAIVRNNHSDTSEKNEHYDIIITGGGMVGTTLACAIANNRRLENKRILLLEGGGKQKYVSQEKYSNRVVALNQQTRTLLSSIGAWQHIEAVRYAPIRKMQVWDACSDAMITFNEDHLSEELAYIVENDLLLHAVTKQVLEKENVKLIYNSRVEEIKLPTMAIGNSEIRLQDGKKYTTELLIGADGFNSLVRKTMGTQYVKWDYDQMGIVATLKLSEPTENIVAWQRFIPTGPIALLPLTDSLSSLVWSVTTSDAKQLLKLSEEEFVDCINNALWKVYPKDGIVEGGLRVLQQLLEGVSLQTGVSRQLQPSIASIVPESRAAFPLGFGHSVTYVKPGAVLVGDAAHRVHPLAGQGVNLGFGDVVVLVKILAEAAISGALLGDTSYLRKYETTRQCQNIPPMLVIDALHRLYKGTAAPVVLARSLALQLTNALPIVKNALIQYASHQKINR